jgi:hypothetical protein
VIEIDPKLKRQLHSALAAESVTLKDWFVRVAAEFITEHEQPRLPGVIDDSNEPRK